MTDSPLKYPARVNFLMLASCRGAKAGANSMITRPAGNSTYKVFSGSRGRQSAGLEAANTSGMLGGLAAGAALDKKTSAHGIKNLKLGLMLEVLHKSATGQGACMSIPREPRWLGEGADARRAALGVVETTSKPRNAADAPLQANP